MATHPFQASKRLTGDTFSLVRFKVGVLKSKKPTFANRRSQMKLSICCLLFGLQLLSPFTSFAQTTSGQLTVPSASTDVPKLVKFSGTAKDETGKLMTGVVGITFSLYKDQQGGSPLWVETQNVQADAAGHYTAMLGSATTEGVPLEVFSSGEAQWLGVQIQGQPAQARVLLVSVPYALKAHEAETLSGRSISDFVLVNKTPSATSNASKTPAGANGASGSSLPPINNDGPTNFVGANATQVVSVTQKGAGAGLSATATRAAGIVGTITGESNTAVYGLASNTSKGSNAAGVTGQANTETGPGVAGYTSSPKGTGVLGVASATTGGTGVSGIANATTGDAFGVSGSTNSTSQGAAGVSGYEGAATGQVYGVKGQTTSTTTSAAGVFGYAQATTGQVYGVEGYTTSTGANAAAVNGYEGAMTGAVYGVSGETSSTTQGAVGVSGYEGAATGSVAGVSGGANSTEGSGVFGSANATSGRVVGVIGQTLSPGGAGGAFTNLSGSGLVLQGMAGTGFKSVFTVDAKGNGFFAGNLNVTGKLTKGSGSFKIDHPLDPANKYLSHSFVESPDMMNVYNGNITTDRHGVATVTLPDYFEALNADFRYQLTVIGQFAQAIVKREIENNRFTIKTNRPSVKVSWQVTGIRHDAYADAYRIPTEEDKATAEQGYYLHPEVFGQPASKSIQAASQKASAIDQLAKVSKQ
jgi:trimeric autotransporter adhesin